MSIPHPLSEKLICINPPDVFIFADIINPINSTMRIFTIVALFTFFIISCGNKKTASLPPAPVSADSVAKKIIGKKYKAADLALISTLISDKNNPYEWFNEIRDTTPFFKNFEKQRLKFGLNFINDSIVEVTDETAMKKATWRIDDQPKSQETAGIFLRLTLPQDEQVVPGQTGNSTITFSYKVLGMDDKQLFLETPNVFTMRKVAALMKTE